MLTAAQVISTKFNGQPNFMTPNKIEFGWVYPKYYLDDLNTAYEISSGSGINGETIYGLTLVDYNPITGAISDCKKHKSQCFHSLLELRKYLEEINI